MKRFLSFLSAVAIGLAVCVIYVVVFMFGGAALLFALDK